MALAVDATSSGTNTTNQSSGGTTTVSHVISGSNRVLIVNISFWNNGGTAAGCSGVTYNGTSMTLVTGSDQNSVGGKFRTEQWYLIAPTTGTHNIVATVGGQCDKLGVAGISFTGADQTNPIDVNSKTLGTSGTVTQSITTTQASTIMTDAVSHLSANTAFSSTGTQIYNDGAVGAGTASQYGTAASSGSNSLSWTYLDPGDEWAYSVLAVAPAGAGGTLYTSSPTASLSFTGSMSKTTSRSLMGTLSSTGSLIKKTSKGLTGTVTSSGSFVKKPLKALSGGISYTTAMSRSIGHVFTSTLSFTGSLAKRTLRALAATLSFTGAFTNVHLYIKALTASLNFFSSSQPFAFVQTKQTSGAASTSLVITPDAALTQGNLVVVNIKFASGGGSSPSVTDNASTPNTYALAAGPIDNGTRLYQFYGVQVTGGATTITCSWSGSIASRITIDEFSGNAKTNAAVFDKVATNTGSGLSTSVALTPRSSGELIVAGASFSNVTGVTAGTGYSFGTSNTSGSTQYKLSSTTSETAPFTLTGSSISWIEIASAFYPADAIKKVTSRGLSGIVSFTGSAIKTTGHIFTASVGFTGALLRRTARALSGALSFTGSIMTVTSKIVTFTASLSFTGLLNKRTAHKMTASLSYVGSLGKRLSKLLTGIISYTGSLTTSATSHISVVFTASVGFTATLARRTSHKMTSAITYTTALASVKTAVSRVFHGFIKPIPFISIPASSYQIESIDADTPVDADIALDAGYRYTQKTRTGPVTKRQPPRVGL